MRWDHLPVRTPRPERVDELAAFIEFARRARERAEDLAARIAREVGDDSVR
jgi:hypothetical protein